MIANYHTHTWRCHHASGTERQYIENAIESGMQILGFSDHTPCPFPGDYYSDYRMYVHQTDEYFRTLTDLKKEYDGQIELHIGVEAEYYPALFDGMVELLRQYPCAEAMQVRGHEAGLHFLLQVKTVLTDAELTRSLDEAGIRIRALSEYYHDSRKDRHCLVVNYSGIKEENLQQALDALKEIM